MTSKSFDFLSELVADVTFPHIAGTAQSVPLWLQQGSCMIKPLKESEATADLPLQSV
jgi:hypothetical protein